MFAYDSLSVDNIEVSKMAYPFKWNHVPLKVEEANQKLFGPDSNQLNAVISEPLGVFSPKAMKECAEKIYNFDIRPDDIWIVTYPKCGTTWTQEMVWQIVNKVDTEKARKIPLWVRSPFIEMEGLFREGDGEAFRVHAQENGIEGYEAMIETVKYSALAPSPRVIKTHLPIDMLPPKLLDTCKVIFVCRNPKDTCVSFYHHYNNFPEYQFKGDFKDFAQLFIDGHLEMGSYWTMLKNAWKYKNHPNLKILWFEEMKKDLIGVIKDVSRFIGYHMTELQVLRLDDHLYIDNFRQVVCEAMVGDPTMKDFIRKGKVGDWKNYFSGSNLQFWDEWIAKNIEGTDIVFPEH